MQRPAEVSDGLQPRQKLRRSGEHFQVSGQRSRLVCQCGRLAYSELLLEEGLHRPEAR